ncbi:MAG: hypothetical protein IT431_10475 [Phycisphaerales bacterium]|nr:hypothetical protein [Phycisphaerales bacterium]
MADMADMASTHDDAGLVFEPSARDWPGLVRAGRADDLSRSTRAALGLPTDRPVIMAGHQPGLWHPGILAKWFAVHALAERVGGAGAWVVVDQSPGAGASLIYPARAAGPAGPTGPARDGGHLSRGAISLGRDDTPPASLPPARFRAPADAALPSVHDALARLVGLLDAHADQPSLARQLHGACGSALGSGAALRSFFASDLHAAPAFARLVGAMREDAGACARLYNEAAGAHPDAGVRELAVSPGAVELPLWERSGEPGPWRTVGSDRLPDLPDERLVLRGLPMTGLLRRWACDLFIHGTGGGASHADGGYDRVTERWLAGWLGATDLAPAVVASATLRLDFGGLAEGVPTPAEIGAARDLAHRAAHDPALLGDADLGREKRELAAQIAALPRGSGLRAELFARMQRLRERGASGNTGALEALRARAEALGARAEEAEIIAERAWPWPFYSGPQIESLRESIGRAFDA